jgi:hypothetical protein
MYKELKRNKIYSYSMPVQNEKRDGSQLINPDSSGSFLIDNLEQFQQQFRSALLTFSSRNAIFKTRIQSGGRISIPEAERATLGIEEGDIIQVILYPVKRSRSN